MGLLPLETLVYGSLARGRRRAPGRDRWEFGERCKWALGSLICAGCLSTYGIRRARFAPPSPPALAIYLLLSQCILFYPIFNPISTNYRTMLAGVRLTKGEFDGIIREYQSRDGIPALFENVQCALHAPADEVDSGNFTGNVRSRAQPDVGMDFPGYGLPGVLAAGGSRDHGEHPRWRRNLRQSHTTSKERSRR